MAPSGYLGAITDSDVVLVVHLFGQSFESDVSADELDGEPADRDLAHDMAMEWIRSEMHAELVRRG